MYVMMIVIVMSYIMIHLSYGSGYVPGTVDCRPRKNICSLKTSTILYTSVPGTVYARRETRFKYFIIYI